MGQTDSATLNIYSKLAAVQTALRVPKSQYNDHGGFAYRSAEDILQAAKPLCIENGLLLTLVDKVFMLGDRYYVRALATVREISTGKTLSVPGLAREEESRKGMSGAQLTGAVSSYARKYALNGLFAIDDVRDDDGLPPAQPGKPTKKTKAAQGKDGVFILTFGAHKDKKLSEVPQKYLAEYLAVKASDPKIKKAAQAEITRRAAIQGQDPDAPDTSDNPGEQPKIKYATKPELRAILNLAIQLYGKADAKTSLLKLLKDNLNINNSKDIPSTQVQGIFQLIQTELAAKRSRESRTNQDVIEAMIEHCENRQGLLKIEAVEKLNKLAQEIGNQPTIDSLDIAKDAEIIQTIKNRIGLND